jgi:hypothetical protein
LRQLNKSRGKCFERVRGEKDNFKRHFSLVDLEVFSMADINFNTQRRD